MCFFFLKNRRGKLCLLEIKLAEVEEEQVVMFQTDLPLRIS